MVRDEVRDLFIRKGFNLREVKSPDYTVVEHKGETVGCIYDDSVYVAQNYPSLNSNGDRSYANTKKTIVMFTLPMTEVEQAIEFLLDSPSRIDRETREQRAENVRKYFKDREDTEFAKSLHDADRS
jgi:hypothetical protein